jgi:hypothetical protein
MAKAGDKTWIINVSSMEGRFASYKVQGYPLDCMAMSLYIIHTYTPSKRAHTHTFFHSSTRTHTLYTGARASSHEHGESSPEHDDVYERKRLRPLDDFYE